MQHSSTHVLHNNRLGSIKKFCLPAVLLFIFMQAFVQVKAYTPSDSDYTPKALIISSLEDCKLPGEMIVRIRQMTPEQMQGLKEEFQQTSTDENGTAVVITIILRFMNDHIVGLVKEAPLNNTIQTYKNVKVCIPVEWVCIPPDANHPQHFCSSIAELTCLQQEHHCQVWVQKDTDVAFYFKDTKRKKRRLF